MPHVEVRSEITEDFCKVFKKTLHDPQMSDDTFSSPDLLIAFMA